ncbi:altronate hydrolase [Anaerotruncus sp. AF02-27]|jgi:altronate dehydratase large subunit|uniref:UxaA family hydrolase n=1 Tax=Anaerotruncus TaxID=244127 RepID=UPI000E497A8D|nr:MULTISPECIES: UxaA family hydrolase [Anaerotruncus]RGX55299.1 altronate hydrolase [Anaerotruncus sp. AF02-27]
MNFMGYRRPDGSVGIRNKLLIVAVDECCEGIARGIARKFDDAVVLTNWYTCMLGGNEETFNQMIAVGKNPNVAGVLVVAMGCGSILPSQVADPIAATGKPADTLTCEEVGGTRRAVKIGIEKLQKMQDYADSLTREPFPMSKLVVGVKCGGSDTSSGIASNPSCGAALDKLVDMGAICIGGELFELQGCEEILGRRAVNAHVAEKINTLIANERIRWSVEGTDVETMSIGNSVGGLTTIEEKSLGALHKTGSRPIQDILQINKDFIDRPEKPGFYLSEVTMLCGGAGVNYASLGAHIILWTSGAAGFSNAVVPVIRVSGNRDLINEDIDIDATGIMDGTDGVDAVSNRIVEKVAAVASGAPTAIEGIGDSTMTLYQKDQRLETVLCLSCAK